MMEHFLHWTEFNESGDSVVSPYATAHGAAVAVAEGFRRAGLDSTLSANRVLRHYQRHTNDH